MGTKTAVRKIESTVPRPFCMQIITPARIYYIAANDEVALDEWVKVLITVSGTKLQNEGQDLLPQMQDQDDD